MKIIDTHIHYLPEYVPEQNILKSMDAWGIETSIVLATPDHLRYTELGLTGNSEAVEKLCARHPDRLVPAIYIEPRNILEAQTQIRRFHDRGGHFLKMWPAHGFSPDDPVIQPVWETANERKMSVILHSGSLGTRPQLPLSIRRSSGFNAKFGQPFLLDQPARYFPDIQFVLAHAAYPWTLEALEMAFMFPNIWVDFSCGLGIEGWNLIEKIRPGRIPWEKFLFASDTAGQSETFVRKWQKIAEHEFFKPHAEAFFHANAELLLQRAGL